MSCMFLECKSLTELDLSNFDTRNVIEMHSFLKGCVSLNKSKIVTNDKKILEEIN